MDRRIGSNASKWTYLGGQVGILTGTCVFCTMKYVGICISIFFWIVLFGSAGVVNGLKDNAGRAGGYVCPPCGCLLHDTILDAPGKCQGCGMPLITVERKHSAFWVALFRNHEITFYHHKLFYPVNFLALFIGITALFRFRREPPTVLFLVFFLSLVLYSFKNQIYGTPYSMYATLRWAFFPISFLLAAPPALYFYISQVLHPRSHFLRRDWWHFLPATFVFLWNALLFFGLESWRDLATYNTYDHFPGLAEQLTFIVSGVFYSFLIRNTLHTSDHPDVRFQKWQWWLRIFLGAAILALAFMIVGNLLFFDLMSTWLDYYPVWLVIAVFTLWSTYFLVFKKEVIFQKSNVKENRLPEAKIAVWKIALEAVMSQQKPYLNPDLSLQMLAQMIGIKDKDLSEVLNIGFSKSFHDFINFYRIEEVKKLLLDPTKQHLTNFAMAQEAGFNSKSAFFGLFKKYVGMTPGEFKRQGKVEV